MNFLQLIRSYFPFLQSREDRARKALVQYLNFKARFFVLVDSEGPITVNEAARLLRAPEAWVMRAIDESNGRVSNSYGLLRSHPRPIREPKLIASVGTSVVHFPQKHEYQ